MTSALSIRKLEMLSSSRYQPQQQQQQQQRPRFCISSEDLSLSLQQSRPSNSDGASTAGHVTSTSGLQQPLQRTCSRFTVHSVAAADDTQQQSGAAGAGASPTRVSASAVDDDDDCHGSRDQEQPNESDAGCGRYGNDGRAWGEMTLETLPHVDHYRNLLSATGVIRKRPTLLELHELEADDNQRSPSCHGDPENCGTASSRSALVDEAKPVKPAAAKFGWIQGVLVRCVLNIFGVMLFLRLSWVTAQAGIGLATVIILLACAVTFLTGLSMSAISTNGEIRGGGTYYMISRSLGPEFGGSIGIIFSLANAVAVAMYIVGFAETIRDILKDHDLMIFDDTNAVRVIGLITAVLLLGIALAGLDWEVKAQIVLLVVLLVAIFNVMIGTLIPPSEEQQAKGFHGYSGQLFIDNFMPDYRGPYSFFTVFAIFFPAATGILAGANISGDLREPQVAIPKGTMLAIAVTTVVYLVLAWMAGLCMDRDAAGPGTPGISLVDSTLSHSGNWSVNNSTAVNATSGGDFWSNVVENLTTHLGGHQSAISDGINWNASGIVVTGKCPRGKCEYGSHNDMQVMQLMSLFGPITVAGIISATLSSALASLVSAPKIFQAVCRDKIFPYITFFGRGFGKAEEPRRAYALTFLIGAACICIGDLNVIAPLISNFFLMSYALVNYACFDGSLAKSPGWRPAFRYYSKWASLVGALLCVAVMFVMDWKTALATIAAVSTLYFYVHYRKPDINWGSSTQAHVYRNSLQYSLKLVRILEHVKNFRPQVLVLTGFPGSRPTLVDFCASFTKHISLMVCGHVITTDSSDKIPDLRRCSRNADYWLMQRRTKSFYTAVCSSNLRLGVQNLMQTAGLGKLRPNTLIIGFKSNWKTAQPAEVGDYFHIIHDAFDLNYGVGILRVREGLDFSFLCAPAFECDQAGTWSTCGSMINGLNGCNFGQYTAAAASSSRVVLPSCNIFQRIVGGMKRNSETTATTTTNNDDGRRSVVAETSSGSRTKRCEFEARPVVVSSVSENLLCDINRFHGVKQQGNIDVWWLFDDGGLTLLIPYLLSTKKLWRDCSLRVFLAGTRHNEIDQEQRHMATLLSKFRIECSMMKIITDIGKTPRQDSLEEFDRLVGGWLLKPGENHDSHPWKISDAEMFAHREKTNRQVRLRELLHQHSMGATLIVMTLPMPRKGLCSAGLYLSWLDILTHDMPPFLLLRGNQESVLTYYS